MEPYLQIDGITLYHGDCLQHDAWLGADVLITDPPYGMAYISNSSKYGSTPPIAGDGNPDIRDQALALWGGKPALIFGTWRVARPAATRHVLIWDKGDSPGMGDLQLPWGLSTEEIYVLGEGWVRKGARGSNIIRTPTISASAANRPDHPTPKPVPLMERLIDHAPPGVITDPFSGSGATLIAARNKGRVAVGYEVEERYCQIIADRLSAGVLFAE